MPGIRDRLFHIVFICGIVLFELLRIFEEILRDAVSSSIAAVLLELAVNIPGPISSIAWIGAQVALLYVFSNLLKSVYSSLLPQVQSVRLFQTVGAVAALQAALLTATYMGNPPPVLEFFSLQKQYLIHTWYWRYLYLPPIALFILVLIASLLNSQLNTDGPFFQYGVAAALPGFVGIAVGLLAGLGWLLVVPLVLLLALKFVNTLRLSSSPNADWENFLDLEWRIGNQVKMLADGISGLGVVLCILAGIYMTVEAFQLRRSYELVIFTGLQLRQTPIAITDAVLRLFAPITLTACGLLFWLFQVPRAQFRSQSESIGENGISTVPIILQPFLILAAPLFLLKATILIGSPLRDSIWPLFQILFPLSGALALFYGLKQARIGVRRTFQENIELPLLALPIGLLMQLGWSTFGSSPSSLFTLNVSNSGAHLLIVALAIFGLHNLRPRLPRQSGNSLIWYAVIAVVAAGLAYPSLDAALTSPIAVFDFYLIVYLVSAGTAIAVAHLLS